MKLGILTGHKDYTAYIDACKELNVEYEVVDILSPDWMNILRESSCRVDGYLARPFCNWQEHKDIYDERIYYIDRYFGKPLYPNFDSLYIYENKRNMAAFLEYHNIPHSATRVFMTYGEAIEFFDKAQFPIVQKANIGSAGSAVTIVKNKCQAKSMARKIFGYGNGNVFCWGVSPNYKKFGLPFKVYGSAQKHYMIVQDFHKIKWEWRILKIGNTYQGHQKLLKGDKASGSGLVGWVAPPEHLLYMVKDICEKGNFDVMDVDIFETEDGQFLVNELQAIFGSYLPYQMKVDGVPGRYVYSEGKGFVFEPGEFNRCGSKLLFVEDFVNKLSNGLI